MATTMERRKLEREFEADMHELAREYKTRARYVATGFLDLLARMSGVETARHLLRVGSPQSGFYRLWELGLLEFSVEVLVLKPKYASLFAPVELEEARHRLRSVNYAGAA